MKIGIIIIFHDNEKDIDKNCFIEQLKNAHNLEICLVNNNSKDNTYYILKDIKEVYPDISIVNIKKLKTDYSAIKAGARYMFNNFNLRHIGYINFNHKDLNDFNLNQLIKIISNNPDGLFKYSLKNLEEKEIKQTLFKKMFSVLDYLRQIKNVKLLYPIKF